MSRGGSITIGFFGFVSETVNLWYLSDCSDIPKTIIIIDQRSGAGAGSQVFKESDPRLKPGF